MNNLYPCVIPSHISAFPVTFAENKYLGQCKIPFSISPFNTQEEIKYIQISLVDFNTNKTLFNKTDYPTGLKTISINDIINENDKLVIKSKDLEDNDFGLNRYGKVQVRAVGVNATDDLDPTITPQRTSSWTQNNLKYMSEWSTVCTIYSISKPQLDIVGLGGKPTILPPYNFKVVLPADHTTVAGKAIFDENDNESLKSYSITLLDNDKKIVEKSDTLYPTNRNEIYYKFKNELERNKDYTLSINILTRNLYQEEFLYSFTSDTSQDDTPEVEVRVEPDEDNGYNKVIIEEQNVQNPLFGHYVIRRASDEDNFKHWEDLYIFNTERVISPAVFGKETPKNPDSNITKKAVLLDFGKTVASYEWIDYTFEAGKFYKYAIAKQYETTHGDMKKTEKPYVNMFQHSYLLGDNKILCVKFDPQISSFKKNILEQKTDTLGSKYPFINRNAKVDYRSFSLSGTISQLMDIAEHRDILAPFEDSVYSRDHEQDFLPIETKLFYDIKDNLSEEAYREYQEYNDNNKIGKNNDFIYEKEFREVVLNWLHNDTIKMFRSPTEGNMLVKITDISLSPKNELGRMIYSFSASITEVDECKFENLNKYGIIDCGQWSPIISNKVLPEGKFIINFATSNDIIISDVIKDDISSRIGNELDWTVSKITLILKADNLSSTQVAELLQSSKTKLEVGSPSQQYKLIPSAPFIIQNQYVNELIYMNVSVGSSFSEIQLQINYDLSVVYKEKSNENKTKYLITTVGQEFFPGTVWGVDDLLSYLPDKYNAKYNNNEKIKYKYCTNFEIIAEEGLGSVTILTEDGLNLELLSVGTYISSKDHKQLENKHITSIKPDDSYYNQIWLNYTAILEEVN